MTGTIPPTVRAATARVGSGTDRTITMSSSRELIRRIRKRGIGALMASGGSPR